MLGAKEARKQRSETTGRHLDRILQDYCKPGRAKDALEAEGELTPLQQFVETEARDLTRASFGDFVRDLFHSIQHLVASAPLGGQDEAHVKRRMAAVQAIMELIRIDLAGEQAAKMSFFGRMLQDVLARANDGATLELTAACLRELVLCGKAVTADLVSSVVNKALIWLGAGGKGPPRPLAAALALKELAVAMPAVFNMHVRTFINSIWTGIRHPALPVRHASVDALRACLILVEKRETRYRVQWYHQLFSETSKGLSGPCAVEAAHGSLLALGELLRHTGEFMLARYKEAAEAVLRFRQARADSKDHLLRRAAVGLVPCLASFAPERFALSYLQQCGDFLLAVLRQAEAGEQGVRDRACAFQALGDLAAALQSVGRGSDLQPFLPRVYEQVHLTITGSLAAPRLRPGLPRSVSSSSFTPGCPYPNALQVVGALARALGQPWKEYAERLLEPMALTGLSQELVDAFCSITQALPELGPAVHAQLLHLLSMVLRDQAFFTARPSYAEALKEAVRAGKAAAGPEAVQRLALDTLANVELGSLDRLLAFVNECVLPMLANAEAVRIRRAAAQAATCVLRRYLAGQHSGPKNGHAANKATSFMVERLVRQLLAAGVGDASFLLRKHVLAMLCAVPALEPYLAQPDCLRALIVALNDEVAQVRATAIASIGRVSARNPAYAMPALRRHLMQLLADMNQAPESRQREESAFLLGRLIQACPTLIRPYFAPVLRALVAKLRDASNLPQLEGPGSPWGPGSRMPPPSGAPPGGGENGVTASVLETTGILAHVVGPSLANHTGAILPLIIDALQDAGEGRKRDVAVLTLAQVVASTGIVVGPYNEYPQLLAILLRLLSEGSQPLRISVVKVLGVIGALDPHKHKTNQADLQGEGKLEAEGVRPQRQRAPSGPAVTDRTMGPFTMEEFAHDVLPANTLGTTSEDYYPTVATNALMRMLRDPTQTTHQQAVTKALFHIFETLGLACVPYLPKVFPVLLSTLLASDIGAVAHLTRLVAQLRQHLRQWLGDVVRVIHILWPPSSPVGAEPSPLLGDLLDLVACLADAMRDEMKAFLPDLLPRFTALIGEAERSSNHTTLGPALLALEAMGLCLEEHLPLVLPALMRLIAPASATGAQAAPTEYRHMALATVRRLLAPMALAPHVSAVVHPLQRALEAPAPDLRRDAADTLCALALALGPDLALFVPALRKAKNRAGLQHERLAKLMGHLESSAPPCMSDAPDWESSQGWLISADMGHDTWQPQAAPDPGGSDRPRPDMKALARAWESSQRSTRDDWAEWMRQFAVVLLQESPSSALRATCELALVQPPMARELLPTGFVSVELDSTPYQGLVQPPMARELFPAGFVSCWSELDVEGQEALVRSLEAALASPSIPPDLVTSLLNLAEFMEHDDKSLPLDIRTLGALAEKCHAYAKALHYRELEFQSDPQSAVEALISINNNLRLPDAADGILAHAEAVLHMGLKESWYEKLNRWDEALAAYEKKYAEAKNALVRTEAVLGRARCLAALAEWERLASLIRREWSRMEPSSAREMAPVAAHAAWHMGHWQDMQTFLDTMAAGGAQAASSEVPFLGAVLHVQRKEFGAAQGLIDKARDMLAGEMAALVGESYERAYGDMIRVQQLQELEEAIAYSRAPELARLTHDTSEEVAADAEARRQLTRQMWSSRLKGVRRNVEVWQALLCVRGLVLSPEHDHTTTLKFASLCLKSGRKRQARRTLLGLLHYDPMTKQETEAGYGAGSGKPDVMFGFLKHMWGIGDRVEAFHRLGSLVEEVEEVLQGRGEAAVSWEEGYSAPLYARMHMRLGMWQWTVNSSEELTDGGVAMLLNHLSLATEAAPKWAKAWHNWALYNVNAMEHYAQRNVEQAQRHVAPAVLGFFRSVALAQAQEWPDLRHGTGRAARGSNLQDILRLLTLWFSHGTLPDVEAALQEGFNMVSIDTWLKVIPQVIARIHTSEPRIRNLIRHLLVRIGRHHPQALMYPLLVAVSSQSPSRRQAAAAVVDQVRQHSATLVEQAELVSQELIRMAILWHEQWHEALEEASRLYFGDSNVPGMLAILSPLHRKMREQGAVTLKEIAFVSAYGRELQEAWECTEKYKQTRKETELHQAWDQYYHVFRRINKQLPTLTVLELQYVAPALVRAQGLELAVPGTYLAGEPVVTITAFAAQLHVITSKQRPRKLTIQGSDGAEYQFLLKGHEDLRQDERVMQLFGLVNNMLTADRSTAEQDLSIARYAVIPLSPNSGLIGWVPNTDTLHALIREYRDARKTPLNIEHRLMLGMSPDYDHLPLINKVEVFQHALESTDGEDLHRVLWLKSRNSEVWLDRRTTYTRSTAVLSVVGYLLGLGDRHPSNLMLDRYSGKLLHIDFGDCFEASMNREKFPERVPFRLTRMMVRAFEVSGIEGHFRHTCESVMRVLRSNRDSVMAMLEAFVHDPLINWRLLNTPDAAPDPAQPPGPTAELVPEDLALMARNSEMGQATTLDLGQHAASMIMASQPNQPRRETREQELLAMYNKLGDAAEVLNERALAVMKRMSDKLTGRDFIAEGGGDNESVHLQVNRLIKQATSHENLCQSYIGWCPFW